MFCLCYQHNKNCFIQTTRIVKHDQERNISLFWSDKSNELGQDLYLLPSLLLQSLVIAYYGGETSFLFSSNEIYRYQRERMIMRLSDIRERE
jgi:hypothetical protein